MVILIIFPRSGVSPAIWDHRVLPATWYRWKCSTLTLAKQAGTRFTYPKRMEGWVYLGVGYMHSHQS